MSAHPPKLVFFDCDTTLSGIEGVDELARLRGPTVLAAVAAMTTAAMEGGTPLEQVFARRLDLIRPRRADMDVIGRLYLEHVEPTAKETIAELKAAGWTPVVLSAGYTPAIEPLAKLLGIARIEAVQLRFDAAGNYAGFDESFPTTRAQGKPARIRELKRELRPVRTAMVGDGVSDLEATAAVDVFVGFGGFVERAKVRAGARHFIHRLSELPALLG